MKETGQMRLTAAVVFLLLLFLVPFSTVGAETGTAVSAGGCHTCGVKTDGTVACWGRDNELDTASQRLQPGHSQR